MKNYTHKIKEEFKIIAIFVAVIWLVFALDLVLPLEKLGLIPRSLQGLIGIVSMTFLHGNFAYLMGNTIPLITLLALLAGSRADSKIIVVLITVLGGSLLWLFGSGQSIHIGAKAGAVVAYGLVMRLVMRLFMRLVMDAD